MESGCLFPPGSSAVLSYDTVPFIAVHIKLSFTAGRRREIMWCVTGKKLSDLERVTSLKVYNWFANRRKEIKRRANIGNVALTLSFSMTVSYVIPAIMTFYVGNITCD